jgi:hypothetical protein
MKTTTKPHEEEQKEETTNGHESSRIRTGCALKQLMQEFVSIRPALRDSWWKSLFSSVSIRVHPWLRIPSRVLPMKKFVLIGVYSWLAVFSSSFASTVQISGLTDALGNPITNAITITGYPKLFTGPGAIIVPRPFTVTQPTNLTLPPAVWTLSIQGWPAGLTFWTDNTASTYALTNVLTTNVWTSGSQWLEAALQFFATNNYVAGTNIALSTNWSGGQPQIAINAVTNGLAAAAWVTNTIQVLTVPGANVAVTTNSNGALVIAVTGVPLSANNGSDFANALLTASNIAVIGVSNQTSILPNGIQANVSAIVGKFHGQILLTDGQGGGGSGVHQVFTWNSYSGTSNWDGGLEIPGPFKAYSTQNLGAGAGAAHWLAASNANNVLEIGQLNTNAYTSIGFADQNNSEQLAMGYGLSNAADPAWQDICEIAPSQNKTTVFGDTSGNPKFGMEGGTAIKWGRAGTLGDFVRYKTGTTNADPSNVVFRVDGSGDANVGGLLAVTNGANINGTQILLNANQVQVGVNGTGNTDNGSFGLLSLNASGTLGGPSILNRAGALFQYLNFASDGSVQLGKYNNGTLGDVFENFLGNHNYGWIQPSLLVGGTNAPAANYSLEVAGNLLIDTNLTVSGALSLATNSTAPANTSVVRAWVTVSNATQVFKMPLYQ